MNRYRMRGFLITGVVLTLAGLFILIRQPTYTREESVFRFGELEARMEQQRTVPGWIGGIALGAGVVLVGVGLKKR